MSWFKRKPPAAVEGRRIELDVRDDLRNKLEPFEKIMTAVGQLEPEDTFVLHATFKPTPLLGVMKVKGYANRVERAEDDHFIVTFVHKSRAAALGAPAESGAADSSGAKTASETGSHNQPGTRHTLDNRGLEPPQPMIRTLNKLNGLGPADVLTIHNDRVPAFLIEELRRLGYTYEVDEQADGSAKVTIRK